MVFKSLLNGAKKLALGQSDHASLRLFPKVDPAIDGEDCLHDCANCTIKYPRNFKIEQEDHLYGVIAKWATHALVATGKTDWVHDIHDEKGSVMEAFGKASGPTNGKLKLSASDMPTPRGDAGYDQPTSVLLLPAFALLDNVTPDKVPRLVDIISEAPTSATPLEPFSLPDVPYASGDTDSSQLTQRRCPHQVVILLCSQKTRDARCGQSAPLLRKELERHLRPLGLYRDLDDERPGGVGIYFISHVGGHKYSANVMIYRRPDPFGLDEVERAREENGQDLKPRPQQKKSTNGDATKDRENGENGQNGQGAMDAEVGAAQCIWLARIKPEDCENVVRYTVLQGKTVKPESQLRGGFDRGRGVMSW